MRLLFIAALCVASACAQDAREIMRRAVQFEAQNEKIALNYTYIVREERQDLDKSGAVEKRKLETWDVTLLEGSPYRRLIARNDQPISASEVQVEEEKLRKSNEERRKETPEQREKRVAEWKKKRAQQREGVEEIAEAFNFVIAGEETRRGADVWVITGTPRPGFKGKTRGSRMLFPNVNCRFWISKKDYAMSAMELELIDSVSFGLILARLSKGSRIMIERTRVNDEVWLPVQIDVSAAARVMLVKGMRLGLRQDFSSFKKFSTDSRILSVEETVHK